MPPSQFLQSFLEGKAPPNVRLIAARGVAPIAPSEMLHLLVLLCADQDPAISAQAHKTLADWTEDEVVHQLRDAACAPRVLQHFARVPGSERLLEAIIANTATPPAAITKLALEVPPRLLELLLDNRVRLLETPEILQNVKMNHSVTPQILRQVQEIEQEFFSGKRRVYSVGISEEVVKEAIPADVLETEALPDDLILEGLPIEEDAREAALADRLRSLTVRQKVKLALVGPREARALLIRDPNRLIAMSVLQSPKLSDNEIEGYASMRNVTDEVLRHIGNSRELTRSYGVAHALVRNPKTPPMTAQRMLHRLTARDLSLLVRDRGVPEAVRRTAQRILGQRTGAGPRQ